MKLNSKLLLDAVYPVGSIYMSVNSTSPATLFGGKWEQLKDRFLLGAGDTYTNGATGGSTTHTHTTGDHTLTVDEIPSHSHGVTYSSGASNVIANQAGNDLDAWGGNKLAVTQVKIGNTGGGKAHNHGNTGSSSNMPPYLTVYIWKRVS